MFILDIFPFLPSNLLCGLRSCINWSFINFIVELLEPCYTETLNHLLMTDTKCGVHGRGKKKKLNLKKSVLVFASGSGPSAWLWSCHLVAGTQCWPGQPIQLGCGSLLHRLKAGRLRVLQSHRYSLWQQVQNLRWIFAFSVIFFVGSSLVYMYRFLKCIYFG